MAGKTCKVVARTASPDSKWHETSVAVTAEAQNGGKQMEAVMAVVG